MTPHDLGLELRQLVLQERRQSRAVDTRRLQAAIGDLCGGQHADLVAPLRYLVLSAPFASAAGQDPPLGDPRLLGRLQQELAQMYAAPICRRLQPLLEGLLGLAASPSAASAGRDAPGSPAASAPVSMAVPPVMAVPPATAVPPAMAVPPATAVPPAMPVPPVPAAPPSHPMVMPAAAVPAAPPRSGLSTLHGVLAFLSGMLLMALAGIGVWILQRSPQGSGLTSPPPAAPSAPPVPVAPPPSAPPVTRSAEPAGDASASAASDAGNQAPISPDAAAADEAAGLERALASVNALYDALSARDYSRARDLFGAAAADQFEPAFFDQFARVSVQDLRLTSQSGSTVNLEGVVRFVYPDGAVQTETRTFTLDTGSDPARITSSAFGRVLKPR